MRTRLVLFSALFLWSAPSAAQVVASWDFEDCTDAAADPTLVVDSANASNAGKQITVTGSGPTCPGSALLDGAAASFSSMHVQETSAVTVPFDATGAGGITVEISTRTSNTASKWWRAEYSISGGAFSSLTPLIEQVGTGWETTQFTLPAGVDGQADVRFQLIATDSNGDGSGTFVQADGDGTPASGGTFRFDNVIVSATTGGQDGGVVVDGGFDAGVEVDGGVLVDGGFDAGVEVDAGPLGPPPVITEVAWMGSSASGSDEFVELYNPGPGFIADLSRFELRDKDGVYALPAVSLPATGVLVLEARDEATSLVSPAAETVPGLNLTNTNNAEFLRICPAGDSLDPAGCDVAGVPGASWPAGSNTTDATMVRRRADLEGALSSSWRTFDGTPSTVTDSAGGAINGDPGEFNPEPAGFDGGQPGEDGGVIVVPDAGPNASPTISLSSPSGSVSSDGEVSIVYSAEDSDGRDTVSVALYYDTDDSGFDGVEIARGLPAGADRTFSWRTIGVANGQYRVFGVVTDDRGETAFAYAPGSVTVEQGAVGGLASITITQPDGVDDTSVDGRIIIEWDLEMPEGENGLISLFLDTDDSGLDGEPLLFGLAAFDPDGSNGPRAYRWDPGEVAPGTYTVYAVLDWDYGTASGYSEFFRVEGEGCGCSVSQDATSMPVGAWWLSGLVLLAAWRRRGRRQQGKCA
jgi:MYXO-CTERM domain-containing protein